MKIYRYRVNNSINYYFVGKLNQFSMLPNIDFEVIKVYEVRKQDVIQMKRFGAVLENNIHLYRYELIFDNNKEGVAYIESSFIDSIGLDNKNIIDNVDEIKKIRSWVLRQGFVYMIKINHHTGYLCEFKQNQFPLTSQTERFLFTKENADKIYNKFVNGIKRIERIDRNYISKIRIYFTPKNTIDLKINIEQLDDLIGKGANETTSKNRIEDIMEIIKNN